MKKITLLLLSLIIASMTTLAETDKASKASKNTKKAISLENEPNLGYPFSNAIHTKTATYISGQLPINPNTGKMVEGNFGAQFIQAVENLSAIAEASGGDLDRINKVTIFLTDMRNYQDIDTVMKAYFTEPYPARSVIGVKELPMGATVEIEAIMESGRRR